MDVLHCRQYTWQMTLNLCDNLVVGAVSAGMCFDLDPRVVGRLSGREWKQRGGRVRQARPCLPWC